MILRSPTENENGVCPSTPNSPTSPIGVGNGFRRPRPPNRACGSPAHGSPVGGFLIGIGSQHMDRNDGEQPLCRVEDISYLPPRTPLPSAANMRSLHPVASTHDPHGSFASAPCLTLPGTDSARICSQRGSHASTFLPPVPRRSFALCASRGFHRCGTMKALTPAPLTTHSAGLPAYLATPSRRSVSNHVGLPGHRLPPRQRDQRVSDFALNEQARRSTPAESSSSSYGPTLCFRLLSTSPRGDAVTFGYGAVAYSGTDFHRADVAPSRAHSFPHAFSGNPGEIRTGPPIKTFGGDGLEGRISSPPPQFSKERTKDTKDLEIDILESLTSCSS
jgi:hypothetical protein